MGRRRGRPAARRVCRDVVPVMRQPKSAASGRVTGARGGLDQLGVAEDVEDGDAQAGFDFEERQVALHSGDFDGVRFARWRHDEFPGRDVPAERLSG